MDDDPPDLPLIDLIEARKAKAAGMELVLENERQEWRQLYRMLAERFLADHGAGHLFTFEDVRLELIQVYKMPPPHHYATWGGMANAVLVSWLRCGRITPFGQRRQVQVRHARIYPVYQVTGT